MILYIYVFDESGPKQGLGISTGQVAAQIKVAESEALYATQSNVRPAKTEPSLKVVFLVPVQKKTFSLKENSLKLVAQYARYLTEHHDQKVDEDMVFEGLVQRLTQDKNFKFWIIGPSIGYRRGIIFLKKIDH